MGQRGAVLLGVFGELIFELLTMQPGRAAVSHLRLTDGEARPSGWQH